jgi:uncharacterized protein YutE (UPF0331/DUF86 family)
MAPDVLRRKLAVIRQLLADLEPFRDAATTEVEAEHYKLERLLELLVTAASDLIHHLLAEIGVRAESYRDAFGKAADYDLLPAELAARLQKAAGMRNILVHLYEDIDYSILRASIVPALEDFRRFVTVVGERATDED